MIAQRFEYVAPESIGAAAEYLADDRRLASVMGGGTMLVPRMTRGEELPGLLVDPRRLGLKHISVVGDDIVIGSRTTYDDILASQLIQIELPLLRIMAEGVTGGRSITGQGTLGGSACFANPASDVPACLAALDARIRLFSLAGTRDVPVSIFFEGGFATNRRHDELASAIVIPKPVHPVHVSYRKVKPAGSSWPILTVACVLSVMVPGALHVSCSIGGLAGKPVWGTATVRDGDTWEADAMLARLTSPPDDAWEDALGDREYRALAAPPVARRVFREAMERYHDR